MNENSMKWNERVASDHMFVFRLEFILLEVCKNKVYYRDESKNRRRMCERLWIVHRTSYNPHTHTHNTLSIHIDEIAFHQNSFQPFVTRLLTFGKISFHENIEEGKKKRPWNWNPVSQNVNHIPFIQPSKGREKMPKSTCKTYVSTDKFRFFCRKYFAASCL